MLAEAPKMDQTESVATTSARHRNTTLETPSGKDQETENFPVASVILAKHHRGHVKTFYDFARAADDVADNPDLSGVEKIARLNVFEDVLVGKPGVEPLEKAEKLRVSLLSCNVTDRHARDLLAAFRMDAEKNRYASWQELLDYCELSANPVGRFLLDLHGEDPAGYLQSDALCTVLQVLNHLQDCGDDRREIDRVYIPADWIEQFGTSLDVLEADRSDPGFRSVLDRMLDECDQLIAIAEHLPSHLGDTRLAINSATIVCLARRLARRLRRGDPLAERVALSKSDFVLSVLSGLIWGVFRKRPSNQRADIKNSGTGQKGAES